MRTDIFVAKAECKWYSGERTLPHDFSQLQEEQVEKIIESEENHPTLNKQFIENVKIEPHEVALDKSEIAKERTPDGKTCEVFEGELIFIIRVPSSLKMDPSDLSESINALLNISSKYSSTKLVAIEYLGTNLY